MGVFDFPAAWDFGFQKMTAHRKSFIMCVDLYAVRNMPERFSALRPFTDWSLYGPQYAATIILSDTTEKTNPTSTPSAISCIKTDARRHMNIMGRRSLI